MSFLLPYIAIMAVIAVAAGIFRSLQKQITILNVNIQVLRKEVNAKKEVLSENTEQIAKTKDIVKPKAISKSVPAERRAKIAASQKARWAKRKGIAINPVAIPSFTSHDILEKVNQAVS